MKAIALLALTTIAFAADRSLSLCEDMQSRFDAAVAAADRMVVASVAVAPAGQGKHAEVSFAPAWETVDQREISALSRVFRINTPPPAQVVDRGPEYRATSVGSYPAFSVTLKKKEEVVITFVVWKSLIGCDTLCDLSAIGVDMTALAPFYSRVIERINATKANKAPEPTTTAVTPPAAQEARQP